MNIPNILETDQSYAEKKKVTIAKVQNGWIVTVYNTEITNTENEQALAAISTIIPAMMQMSQPKEPWTGEGVSPDDVREKMLQVAKTVNKRPLDVYVFVSLHDVILFVTDHVK